MKTAATQSQAASFPRRARWRRGARAVGLALLLAGGCGLDGARAAPAQPDLSAAFDAANRLYEQASYREAAAAYQALLDQGVVSPALHFNLGNAWFKAGEAGRAILQYRLAARLAPRDPDIRANLRLTRELVLGAPPPDPPLWRRATAWLTLQEWGVLTAGAVWLCFGALAAGELQARRRGTWRRAALGAGVVAVVAGAALAGKWCERRLRLEAVVVVKEAVVRYGPLAVSPELQKAGDGTELRVVDQKDGWLQVTGLPRGPGWIQQTDVALLPP